MLALGIALINSQTDFDKTGLGEKFRTPVYQFCSVSAALHLLLHHKEADVGCFFFWIIQNQVHYGN